MKALTAILVAISYTICYGQDPTALPDPSMLTLDFKTFSAAGNAPHNKSFGVTFINLDANVKKISWKLYTGRKVSKGDLLDEGDVSLSTTNAVLPIAAILDPNTSYYFHFEFFKADSSRFRDPVYYGFTTRTKLGDYVKLDFGLGYADKMTGIIGHTAVHLYLVPLGNDADISQVSGAWRKIFVRTSIYGGISPLMLYSDTKQSITNSTSAGNLIYGIGIRSPFFGWKTDSKIDRNLGWVFLQPLRINFGSIYFKQDDANPLITKNKGKQVYYVGFSYDLNIAGVLGPIGKLLKP